jgi:hypothetical protein
MNKVFIILITSIVVGGVGLFGWMYMQASSELQKAEQQQQVVQEKSQEAGEGEEEKPMSDNGRMQQDKQAETLPDDSDRGTADEPRTDTLTESTVIISPETLPVGPSQVVITLEGMDGISGFNLALEAGDGVIIENYADDLRADGKEDSFEQVLAFVSDDNATAKVSYITLELEDAELPKTATFSFNVTSEGAGGTINVSPEGSEMVGPQGIEYAVE